MTEHDEVHLDIDPMLFLATYIEDQVELIDMLTGSAAMFGVADLGDAVAGVAHEQIVEAQTALDNLIAEDTTWRPA